MIVGNGFLALSDDRLEVRLAVLISLFFDKPAEANKEVSQLATFGAFRTAFHAADIFHDTQLYIQTPALV